jgi:predicted metal-dependent phosphoesterase TrpH
VRPGPPAGPGPGERRIELHAHTHFSDGALSPESLVELAVERGLIALAVTDHDSVEGIAPAVAAARARLEVIPGIEVSSTLEGQDVHILGYFVDAGSPALGERLERFRGERRDRARAILDRLAALGVPVPAEEVFATAGPGVVGRPHIAQALVRAGHVPSLEVAFQRLLGRRGSAYVPRPAFASTDAVGMIRDAGGVAVLAHPGPLARTAVESLLAAGLAGVEVWHPQHGPAAQRHWHQVASELGLVASGGSDFHGPQRGAGLGDLPVPERALEALRERARSAAH